MKDKLLVILFVALICLFTFDGVMSVQIIDQSKKDLKKSLSDTWSLDKLRLFDLSRFSMNQSYSMFYVSGYQGGTFGLYSNVLTYRLSDPLQVRFKVDYLMQPWPSQQKGYMSSSGQFFPGLMIQYKPRKNMYINFQIERLPGYAYPYGFYGIGRMFDTTP